MSSSLNISKEKGESILMFDLILGDLFLLHYYKIEILKIDLTKYLYFSIFYFLIRPIPKSVMLKPIPISLLSKFIMDIFRSNSFLTRLEKDLLSEALDF